MRPHQRFRQFVEKNTIIAKMLKGLTKQQKTMAINGAFNKLVKKRLLESEKMSQEVEKADPVLTVKEKERQDTIIKNFIMRATGITDGEMRASVKKVTGYDDNQINDLFRDLGANQEAITPEEKPQKGLANADVGQKMKANKSKKINRILRYSFGIPFIGFGTLGLLFFFNDNYFKNALQGFFLLIIGLILLPSTINYIKKIRWYLAGIIILLAFLNPKLNSFKNFSKELSDSENTIYKLENNFIIFSIYKKEWASRDETDYVAEEYYLGILGNFFKIKW